jgi:hypothetical protein
MQVLSADPVKIKSIDSLAVPLSMEVETDVKQVIFSEWPLRVEILEREALSELASC